MCAAPLKYLAEGSAQRLSEGIAEYYAHNHELFNPSRLPADVAELFRQHDAGHVVFACDTSLRGETLIDTWTIFATTAGLRGYLQYFKYPQVNQVFADTGYFRIVLEFVRCLPDAFRVFVRSRRMPVRWPWEHYRRYLDRPLSDIRREFNIRVV